MRIACLLSLVALATLASSAPTTKLVPAENISIMDVVEAAYHIKEICQEIEARIKSGVIKSDLEDFLRHIRDVVETKIKEVHPGVAKILEKMKAAVEVMIHEVKAGIETAKPSQANDLHDKILRSALGKAIETLISAVEAIQKHLGDLINKFIPSEYSEYLAIPDIMEIFQHFKDILFELKVKIASGEIKTNIVDFLIKLKAIVEAKIAAANPIVKVALEKVQAAIGEIISKAEAGIEQGKGLLVEFMKIILEKLVQLKNEVIVYSISEYNIFGDFIDNVWRPAVGKATEILIPVIEAIQKHLGDLIGKFIPSKYAEYLAIPDIMEIVKHIKEIVDELKAKIASGEVKANVVDFLNKLKDIVEGKISAANPIVKAALEKVKAAIGEIIAKSEAGIVEGSLLLETLLELILEKLMGLKNELTGYNIVEYNIFGDLLDKYVRPALGKAIETLIPAIEAIQKRLGDLIGKFIPSEYAEYLAIPHMTEIFQDIKEIFDEVNVKFASGEVKANAVDFLNALKASVEAKIAAADPTVKAALEKVQDAIGEIIVKAEAGIEQGKGLLVQLLEKISDKLANLKDDLTGYNIGGYNIFDDFLGKVLFPTTMNLGNLIGKAIPYDNNDVCICILVCLCHPKK